LHYFANRERIAPRTFPLVSGIIRGTCLQVSIAQAGVPLVLLQHLPDEELHSLAQPRASEGVLALEDVLALGAETSVLSLPPMGLSD